MSAAEAHGWRLNTPSGDQERGGSVVIDVPDGARVTEELLRRQVIVDYRPNAGIRVAPHFYNTEQEIDRAIDAIAEIVTSQKLEARS
jgi:kynureninase